MEKSVVDGYCVLERKVPTSTPYFGVSDMQIYDATLSVHPGYFILTGVNNKVPTFRYTEFSDGEIIGQGEAVIIYKTGTSRGLYTIVESKVEQGVSINIGDVYYKLEMTTKSGGPFKRVYYERSEIVYEEDSQNDHKKVSGRVEDASFKITKCLLKNNDLKQIIPIYISPLEPSERGHLKLDVFIFSSCKAQKIIGYSIIHQSQKEIVECHVLISQIFSLSYIPWLIQIFNKLKDEEWESVKRYITTLIALPFFPSKYFQVNFNQSLTFRYFRKEHFSMLEISKNVDFILKILLALLLECKILFISSSTSLLFQTISFFTQIMDPFEWEHLLCTPLPFKLLDLLETPFPFIIGVKSSVNEINKGVIKRNKILLVDLDSLQIDGRIENLDLPFKEQLANSLKGKRNMEECVETLKRYFNIIENNIVIAREKYILKTLSKENCSDELRSLIYNPTKIITRMVQTPDLLTFFKKFFETRIFKSHISRKKDLLIDKYYINISETFKASCVFYPYGFIPDVDKTKVYELWLNLYPGDLRPPALFFSKDKEALEKLAPLFFALFSENREYPDIVWFALLLKQMGIRLNPDMYVNINIKRGYQRIENVFFKFLDLSSYNILILKTCDCRILFENEQVKEWIREYEQNKFLLDLGEDKCSCDGSYSTVLLVYEKSRHIENIRGMYRLLLPENLLVWMNRMDRSKLDKRKMLESYELLFWNIAFYFVYLELPINELGEMDIPNIDFIYLETKRRDGFNTMFLPRIHKE
jgi:hypothetical protein